MSGDGRSCPLAVVHNGFAGKPEEFGGCLFCDDFEVVGLQSRHKTYGLGVPLICTRAHSAPAPKHLFYPKDISFPATALLRFDGTVADVPGPQAGRLELYNPVAMQSLQLAGRTVPLETDLTTPLAYFVSRSDLDGIEYLAFVHADRLRD